MMKANILVDSEEFWFSFKEDLLSAKDSIYIQTLSFEGDSVGKRLVNFLMHSSAPDKRVIMDSTTMFKISDKFLFSPKNLIHSDIRSEVKETRELIQKMREKGIRVKFVNPAGPFYCRTHLRNHKKSLYWMIETPIWGVQFLRTQFPLA